MVFLSARVKITTTSDFLNFVIFILRVEMHPISTSSFLVSAAFLQTFTTASAKQCPYSNYGDTVYYTCPSNQYCCGRNSCCYSNDYYYGVYDLWYFWFCLCFGIFICSLASGAYYRKRQLRGVQVAAIHPRNQHHHQHNQRGTGNPVQVMHGHGAMNGRLGPDGLMHPHPRNVMVTTTDASGHPIYPPQGYYDGEAPNYAMFSTSGGPVYPAYAYLPPPPSYSSLAARISPAPSVTTSPSSSPSSTSSSSSTSRSDVPTVST
ncbi:vesicular, overexpressed in cancer, prosurvival protein 1-like [Acanthaster planci]|uniref:WW domain binding protein VOPP1 n=1 Tax=Acanthaster planci TaxID=133434 RepID=A0A8B7XGC3_ACAPL|nr:vesicular, overexpressed in cancer, prosurvival protein 1-like [Acanthaster planci]